MSKRRRIWSAQQQEARLIARLIASLSQIEQNTLANLLRRGVAVSEMLAGYEGTAKHRAT